MTPQKEFVLIVAVSFALSAFILLLAGCSDQAPLPVAEPPAYTFKYKETELESVYPPKDAESLKFMRKYGLRVVSGPFGEMVVSQEPVAPDVILGVEDGKVVVRGHWERIDAIVLQDILELIRQEYTEETGNEAPNEFEIINELIQSRMLINNEEDFTFRIHAIIYEKYSDKIGKGNQEQRRDNPFPTLEPLK